ncbi:MAG: hypothetical protein ACHP7P_14100 [Terriglobales bacterium]
MAPKRPASTPRPKNPSAPALLTRRVRKLIDLAYGGNVRLASMTTGLPYATLRDLYTGRTLNPGIATLQLLADRHGFSEQWFLSEPQGDGLPMGGWGVFLPRPLGQPDGPEYPRMSFIPYAAWPLNRVWRELYDYLDSLPATESRPILGAATEDVETSRRLGRFLFAPLLAAEALGEQVMHTGTWDNEKWLAELQALGRLWEQLIPDLLVKARAHAEQQGRSPTQWMGFNPDHVPASDRPREQS